MRTLGKIMCSRWVIKYLKWGDFMITITKGKFVEPSLIENTTMQEVLKNGVLYAYYITPEEGYVLHDKMIDEEVCDIETGVPTGKVILGYKTSVSSVEADYDFVANPRELYAVPEGKISEQEEHYDN